MCKTRRGTQKFIPIVDNSLGDGVVKYFSFSRHNFYNPKDENEYLGILSSLQRLVSLCGVCSFVSIQLEGCLKGRL